MLVHKQLGMKCFINQNKGQAMDHSNQALAHHEYFVRVLLKTCILSTSKIQLILKEISFITWQKIQFYVELT